MINRPTAVRQLLTDIKAQRKQIRRLTESHTERYADRPDRGNEDVSRYFVCQVLTNKLTDSDRHR